MAGKAFHRSKRSEPIWFEVPGADDNPVRFYCADDMPGGLLLDFGAIMSGGEDEGAGASITKAVTEFFEAAINPDQYEQWIAMTHDTACGIGLSMMTDIAAYLGQEYSGDRPTGASSAPTSPSPESGSDSKDGVLPVVSTYSRSVPVGVIH